MRDRPLNPMRLLRPMVPTWGRMLLGAVLPAVALLLLTGLAALWVVSWSQTYGWPTVLQGPSVQLHVRTGRVFVLRVTCQAEDSATFISLATPHVPGMPGGRGYNFFVPGEDEAIDRASSGQLCKSLTLGGAALPAGTSGNLWGFGMTTYPTGPSLAGWKVLATSIPMWFIALVLCGPVLYAGLGHWIPAFRRRRRMLNQLCMMCGYDLRASTDRCPECGTPVRIPATSHIAGQNASSA